MSIKEEISQIMKDIDDIVNEIINFDIPCSLKRKMKIEVDKLKCTIDKISKSHDI